MAQKHAIGIDLGTSYTKVAVVLNGQLKIIHNAEGKNSIPSCVCFSREKILIGHRAKKQSVFEPENSVYDVKRIIGRKYNDKFLQHDMKNWPFKVVNVNDEPRIQVKNNKYHPEEISALILKEMKKSAEQYLDGTTVKDAVITVPAHFTDSQLKATKNAAELAGLNVLELLVEPTAAALSYGLDSKSSGIRKIFVFDFGGGTMDASLLEIEGTNFKVLAVQGDSNLGGLDLDNNLAEHVKKSIIVQHKLKQSLNDKDMRRVTYQCESAKIALSVSQEVTVDVPDIVEGVDAAIVVTRKRFEHMNDEVFTKLIGIVERTLERAGVAKNQIDDIVLVGGSSLVPKVKEIVKEFFDGKKLYENPNPSEAVVKGAAIRASSLSGGTYYKDINLQNILPLSIGIEDHYGEFQRIIERNAQVPVKVNKIFRTSVENQRTALFPIYEGESNVAKENHLLGKLIVKGLPPGTEGEVKFEVIFEVDKDRILEATVIEQTTGCHENVSLQLKKPGLTKAKMDNLNAKMRSIQMN